MSHFPVYFSNLMSVTTIKCTFEKIESFNLSEMKCNLIYLSDRNAQCKYFLENLEFITSLYQDSDLICLCVDCGFVAEGKLGLGVYAVDFVIR